MEQEVDPNVPIFTKKEGQYIHDRSLSEGMKVGFLWGVVVALLVVLTMDRVSVENSKQKGE